MTAVGGAGALSRQIAARSSASSLDLRMDTSACFHRAGRARQPRELLFEGEHYSAASLLLCLALAVITVTRHGDFESDVVRNGDRRAECTYLSLCMVRWPVRLLE